MSPIGTTQIGIIMGSQSDWETMRHAAEMRWNALDDRPRDVRIVSAHRTPDRLAEYAKTAQGARAVRRSSPGRAGAAHLPGMCAAWTPLPVLGVPVESHALKGMDSLLSIVQMPAGHSRSRRWPSAGPGR